MIEAQLPGVMRQAKRLKSMLPAQIEVEELAAEGALGLVEAAQTFDPTKGAAFGTWARYRVRGRMVDFARNQGRRKDDVSIDEILGHTGQRGLADELKHPDKPRLAFICADAFADADATT